VGVDPGGGGLGGYGGFGEERRHRG
jgi:hypothetical protein